MKNIFFDLDNTIFKLDIRKKIKYRFDLDMEVEGPLFSMNYQDSLRESVDTLTSISIDDYVSDIFNDPNTYRNQESFLNNKINRCEVFSDLADKGYQIHIVSARHDTNEIFNMTIDSLNDYIRDNRMIDLITTVSLGLDAKARVDMMESYGSNSILVDDNPDNLKEALSRGFDVYCIRNGLVQYNKEIESLIEMNIVDKNKVTFIRNIDDIKKDLF